MRGHEEASGTKYVPKELFTRWELNDSIKNFELFLILQQVITANDAIAIKEEIKNHIEEELKTGFDAAIMIADTEEEINDVYAKRETFDVRRETADVKPETTDNNRESSKPRRFPAPASRNTLHDEQSKTTDLRFIDAIKQGLHQSMKQHSNLVLMGQDIAEYGGAFKITEGFVEEFGKNRVRNTPLCESAIVGAALGLSLEGYKSMMEMQFADFVTVGFNQIVNNLAKIHYRWAQNADVVIRMPTGGGMGAGPFHSQSNEAWFVHTPGLKVVYPSSSYDAKGLLIAAINDPNPVLFFEHKGLYRSVSGQVPEDYYEIEIGKAKLVQQGEDISIITYGSGVHWAVDYAAKHKDISIEILDLRTLLP
jgi:2-oxoisovalerate dehydrogenase E1 component